MVYRVGINNNIWRVAFFQYRQPISPGNLQKKGRTHCVNLLGGPNLINFFMIDLISEKGGGGYLTHSPVIISPYLVEASESHRT